MHLFAISSHLLLAPAAVAEQRLFNTGRPFYMPASQTVSSEPGKWEGLVREWSWHFCFRRSWWKPMASPVHSSVCEVSVSVLRPALACLAHARMFAESD